MIKKLAAHHTEEDDSKIEELAFRATRASSNVSISEFISQSQYGEEETKVKVYKNNRKNKLQLDYLEKHFKKHTRIWNKEECAAIGQCIGLKAAKVYKWSWDRYQKFRLMESDLRGGGLIYGSDEYGGYNTKQKSFFKKTGMPEQVTVCFGVQNSAKDVPETLCDLLGIDIDAKMREILRETEQVQRQEIQNSCSVADALRCEDELMCTDETLTELECDEDLMISHEILTAPNEAEAKEKIEENEVDEFDELDAGLQKIKNMLFAGTILVAQKQLMRKTSEACMSEQTNVSEDSVDEVNNEASLQKKANSGDGKSANQPANQNA